jgi:hypothetical protein
MAAQHRGAQYLVWAVVLTALVALTASWACDDPPPVGVNSLGRGDELSGTVTIEATRNPDYAEKDVTISRVEFIAMGETIASFTQPPYVCKWDTTKTIDGHCNLKAVAYDGEGRPLFPPGRAPVSVFNAVKVSQPAADAVVSGVATIAGTVKDGVTVSLIHVYVGGKRIGSVTEFPFSLQWDSSTVGDGQHFLRLKAYDGKRLVRLCRVRFKIANEQPA